MGNLTVEVWELPDGTITRKVILSGDSAQEVMKAWRDSGSPGISPTVFTGETSGMDNLKVYVTREAPSTISDGRKT